MNTKFLENDSKWKTPKKFLIGENQFIENALSYEVENDARIDELQKEENKTGQNGNPNNIILPSMSSETKDLKGRTAVPVKIKVDSEDENYDRLIEIASKKRRTEDEKTEFFKLLSESVKNDESDFEISDKTGKFDWDNMKIIDFRCFGKKAKAKTGYWKFKNYQNNFRTENSFINNTANHKAGQCEILVCKDKYLLKDENGKLIEKNPKTTWWIGYKY